ncbi:Retrovirus-related Pol polyprotein from transposon TNT 1-94 [Gossypium australe]|uniref:Retrovirus-related Pol polyprotein from transposon TNT 1-94 n=1 Tax=Gossypium australe TaxID=47621 RepID=A0A5B6URN4_9ROSI|nr:Retrovirus-related Pol polyprotein from transposon TNT 1-94 [Gossypium australe]
MFLEVPVSSRRIMRIKGSLIPKDDPLKTSVEAFVSTSNDHSQTNDRHDGDSKKDEDEIEAETKDQCDEFDQPQPSSRVKKNHSTSNIIFDIHDSVQTREKPRQNYRDMVRFACYTSQFEPKRVEEALQDVKQIQAMPNELQQFERNEVWQLVPRPVDAVDFNETFALVARLKVIRMLLVVATHLDIKLYQMDVKSAFLNGYINE